jgi:hypothetical protein
MHVSRLLRQAIARMRVHATPAELIDLLNAQGLVHEAITPPSARIKTLLAS